MSLSRRNPKRDTSEGSIILALLKCGFSVQRISESSAPDLVLGKDGICRFCEVKTGNQPLRPSQAAWWRTWRGGSLLLIRDVEEAGIVAEHWGAGIALICSALFTHRAAQVSRRMPLKRTTLTQER